MSRDSILGPSNAWKAPRAIRESWESQTKLLALAQTKLGALHLRPRQQAVCLAALLHLRQQAVCLAALLHLRPRQQAVCLAGALLHLRPRQQAVCLAALLHLRPRPQAAAGAELQRRPLMAHELRL